MTEVNPNPTAIQDVNNKMAVGKGDVFDLQGRKVGSFDSSLRKGIYIVNGKKIIR